MRKPGPKRVTLADVAAKADIDLRQPFVQAFLTNALNPKVALFYLAVLPQFASGPNAPVIGVLLIAIHFAWAALYFPVVAFTASRARRTIASPTGCSLPVSADAASASTAPTPNHAVLRILGPPS